MSDLVRNPEDLFSHNEAHNRLPHVIFVAKENETEFGRSALDTGKTHESKGK